MKTGNRTGPSAAARNPGSARRLLFIGLGLASMGVGAVGVFVPGLPTTIFLIAASYLFARSSPSLHRKLIEHPRLGPYLQNFADDRSMPARAKAWSLLLMWAGITLSVLLAGGALAFAAVMGSLGLIGTGMILFYVRTSARPHSARETQGAGGGRTVVPGLRNPPPPAVNSCKQSLGLAPRPGGSMARRFEADRRPPGLQPTRGRGVSLFNRPPGQETGLGRASRAGACRVPSRDREPVA